MEPNSKIKQDTNVCSLPFKIYDEITRELNKQDIWKDLLSTTDLQSRYSLNENEVNDCIRKRLDNFGSSGCLLTKWGNKGMDVGELVDHMDQLDLKAGLHMERCLKLIKFAEKLVITDEPVLLIEARVGDLVHLECVATGFPYPRYTWFKFVDDKLKEFPTKFNGKLTFSSLGCTDSGSYICRVHQDNLRETVKWSNSGQWSKLSVQAIPGYLVDTKTKSITVNNGVVDDGVMSPMFQLQPVANVSVDFHGDFVLQCRAVGNPALSFSWLKDDTLIPGQTQDELWVRSAMLADGGDYQCVARNKYGESKSHKANVYVKVKAGCDMPVITSHPTSQRHGIGGVATFRVEANGTPPLHYKWYHNGKTIPDNTASTLTLRVEDRTDSGMYQCRVSSFLPDGRLRGECISREAKLEVDIRGKLSYTAVDKVALLIAVSSTKVSAKKDLPGALNDLSQMCTKLQELDFKTVSLLDLNLNEMCAVVDFFYHLLAPGVYCVVYLCGHGFIYRGRNYIVPWDAHFEPRPEDCFCVEDAVYKLQGKRPAVFCMILDICRSEHKDFHVPNMQLNPLPPVYGNELFLFATSQDEKSYEEKPSNLPSQTQPRGLFNQYLTRIIQKNIPIIDLFKEVVSLFKECPYPMDKTPQHPQVVAQITEHQRSLCDPVDYTGRRDEMDKRIKQWQNVHNLPKDQKYPICIPQCCVLHLNVRCEQVFSNSLRVHIAVTMVQKAAVPPTKYLITIDENSVPVALRPMEHRTSGAGQFVFTFNNLQRLESELVLVVRYAIYFEHMQTFGGQERISFGMPLMSQQVSLFRKQHTPTYCPSPATPAEHRRQPTEHAT